MTTCELSWVLGQIVFEVVGFSPIIVPEPGWMALLAR